MKNNNLAASALLASSIFCTQTSFATNGYQLIGIGSYQKGLAGAVTANPGSAMTAITNPAGMARVGKRADFSLEMFMPERNVDFTNSPSGFGERKDSEATQYGVPALGWTAPIEDDSDIYFGGGIYGTSGLGTDYPLTQMAQATAAPSPDMYFEGYSSLQFWQMAPTLAWDVDNKLSLGVSLNIDYQSVSLRQAFIADTNADSIAETKMMNLDLSRSAQAFGFGFTLGTLYDINEQVTVGASYKSKQQFSDMKYQLSHGDIQDQTGQLPLTGCTGNVCPAGTYSLELDFPEMISLGVAYTPVKPLTLSLDIKMIKWSDTLNVMKISGPNGMTLNMPAGWDDQTIIAIGADYQVTDRLTLRAGFNHSDAPIDNADTDSNYILPAVTTTHYAFGGDYQLGKYWELGFHASKAKNETLTSPNASSLAKIGLGITTVGINIGYHF